ncbi:Na+/H+ antiporter NhaA [Microbacterium sp. YY-01]|uniref:Na+/H+ antiporter NhaA n=1 Tax=Microbacterium sp. YY-01 TaxID=3421634 RepID=UPI003D17AD9E
MSKNRSLLRSQQFPAILLLGAALVGLLIANTPAHDPVAGVLHSLLSLPGTSISLPVTEWISDGILVIFFFVVALELRYEVTRGDLNSIGKAVQPAIAATGGILVPVLVYLAVAQGSDTVSGWPIPTATDIAFALGVLAMFGRGLPTAVRAFLLALAILDDIVGIIFIAVLFATDVNFALLGLAIIGVIAFGALSYFLRGRGGVLVAIVMVAIAVAVWLLVLQSGIHATIAGVALGLVMAPRPADHARHALEPWVNALILPIFAFAAAFVVIPRVAPSELSPAFWAVVLALPVGKIIGITAFGWLSLQVRPRGTPPTLAILDVVAAGALGGIGFTVSLLLANLAFAADPATSDQAILGVLVGSLIALVLSIALVSGRARYYRRRAPGKQHPAVKISDASEETIA